MKFNEYDPNIAKAFIQRWEGAELVAYQCSAGVWTIGYGHTTHVIKGMKITQAQAEEFLDEDLKKIFKEMCELVSVDVTEGQFIALMSFAFNLGTTKFKGSTLRRCLNRGDTGLAADEFPRWHFSEGESVPGLLARRRAERELFLGGQK